MPGLVERVGNRAAAEIQKFRDAAAAFSQAYTAAKNNPPPFVVSPEIMRDYERMMSRAKAAATAMQATTRTIDSIAGAVWRTTGQDLGAIVVVPAVAIAGIAGATATLLYATTQLRIYLERRQVANAYISQNVDPGAAWTRARATVSGGLFSQFGNYGYIVAGGIAVALFMFAKRVK